MARKDGRACDAIRATTFQKEFLKHPAGSVLVTCGDTRVICAASIESGIPRWMKDQNVAGGWVTAEYSMLPGATGSRNARDITRGRPNGRSMEIQRLIGRSLRAVCDLKATGPRTLYLDCDVIDADGGTRCASINGANLALRLALQQLFLAGELNTIPMKEYVGAISVGMVNGEPMLDLNYEEDASAAVDMNVVMTESGRFIEIQGTGEEATFSRQEMDRMLDLAAKGILEVIELQKQALIS